MKFVAIIFALASAVLLSGRLANAADAQRGQTLYELRCGECHSESVHGRAQRAATKYPEIRYWVTRWSSHLGGFWREEEISDVTKYLNETYYGFSCGKDDDC
jgi:mono/diheme cytochrome c family protein